MERGVEGLVRTVETLCQSEGRSLRSRIAYQNGCMLVQFDSSFTRRAAIFLPCLSLEVCMLAGL
jgi:hypothetical protein